MSRCAARVPCPPPLLGRAGAAGAAGASRLGGACAPLLLHSVRCCAHRRHPGPLAAAFALEGGGWGRGRVPQRPACPAAGFGLGAGLEPAAPGCAPQVSGEVLLGPSVPYLSHHGKKVSSSAAPRPRPPSPAWCPLDSCCQRPLARATTPNHPALPPPPRAGAVRQPHGGGRQRDAVRRGLPGAPRERAAGLRLRGRAVSCCCSCVSACICMYL
jgi:hypothetical protein